MQHFCSIFLALFCALLCPWPHVANGDFRIDCDKAAGVIRPLHGGNCGPVQAGGLMDLSAGFRELGVPYVRLHDCHWPITDVVDIHAIFPDFKADPALPASYDFERTDEYITAVVKTGAKIIYRLGESIEHTPKKRYVHPPADDAKWAAICLGIIRHYNEAWANGFNYNIKYWEIWNEPENRPAMWSGTDEDYLRLYETAAKEIKKTFPDLKVGGPALGSNGRIVDGRFEPTEFVKLFLDRCRTDKTPLDFFSWHLYSDDPSECMKRAAGLRALLNSYGFDKTELHFNEWNYLPGKDWGPMLPQGQGDAREKAYAAIGGLPGAAFAACTLINMQDTPIDIANYYMMDNQGFGLFTTHGKPRTSFLAFKAFRALLDTPQRIECKGGDTSQVSALAGINADRSQVQVLISNYKSGEKDMRLTIGHLPWKGRTSVQVYVVDATHELTKIGEDTFTGSDISFTQELPAPALCVIRMSEKK